MATLADVRACHDKDEEEAMRWFRRAADAGHPEAAYNLAVGHLTGVRTDVRPGEIHELIRHAHDHGVEEASDVLVRQASQAALLQFAAF